MESTLGARLRAQREQQQIDLTAIAAATKIKVSLLEALEADEVTTWPKGIFGRAYLRDYARAIGFDADVLIREFYELHPDPVMPMSATALATELANEPPSDSTFRRLVNSAIGAMPNFLSRPKTLTVRRPADESSPADLPMDSANDAIEDAPGMNLQFDQGAPIDAEPPAAAGPAFDELPRYEDQLSPVPAMASIEEPPPPRMPIPAVAAVSADIIVRLSEMASICMRLGRAAEWRDVEAVLADVARVLDATGVILWSWQPRANLLRPALAHGYSMPTLSKMAFVRTDDHNPLAEAFRAGEACTVEGDDRSNGAVLVPLIAPRGRVGMLSLELRSGAECRESVRAFAMLLAAQLVTLVDVQAIPHAATA
jgi:hypothetical protein